MSPGGGGRPSAALAVAATALTLGTLVPLAALAHWGLGGGPPRPGRRAGGAAAVLGDPTTWRLVGVTVAQAAASVVLTLAIGLPIAWAIGRYRFRGRSVLRALVTVPFVLPTVVVGAAVGALWSTLGWAGGGWAPILAAHAMFNVAVVVRTVGAAVELVDPRLEDTARMLGAGRVARIGRVAVPALAPAVASAALIVFLFCLTSFGVVQVLGGPGRRTVETEIWYRVSALFDLSGAAVLALVQTVTVVVVLVTQSATARRAAGAGRLAAAPLRTPVGAARVTVATAWSLGLLVVVPPVAVMVARSLRGADGPTLVHWRRLGSVVAGTNLAVPVAEAMVNSLVTALWAALPAVTIGVATARLVARGGRRGRWVEAAVLLPLGVSAATVGIGMLLAYGRPPVDLRGVWWLVPAAQAVIALPLVVRSVVPSLRARSPRLEDAARTLGAGPRSVLWRVELPLARGAVTGAAGLALAVALGEFGATTFLARADRPTLPLVIERLLGRPGLAGYGQAMAASCLLSLLCAAAFLLVDRRGAGDAARF